MRAQALALALAILTLSPVVASAQPSATLDRVGKMVAPKAWTIQYDNAIEETRSPPLTIPIEVTCVLEKDPSIPRYWKASQTQARVWIGGKFSYFQTLCSDVLDEPYAEGWPQSVTLKQRQRIRVPIQISPSLRIDSEDCSGYCAVVRGNRTLRLGVRVVVDGKAYASRRMIIRVSNHRPERTRRIWLGTDAFVNVCINASLEIRSSGGRLYCETSSWATARATARIA
jgi:hypothetical protein